MASWLVRSSTDRTVRVRALSRGQCVVFLGQDTLPSQCLSLPRSINGYRRFVRGNLTNCWLVTCDGLASRPGGVEILQAASCYGNRDKLRPGGASWLYKAHFIGIFDAEVQPNYTICGFHRCTLGIYWKGKRQFCQVPHQIVSHKKERAKGDRAVSAEIDRQIFLQTLRVVSVGSSKVPPFLFTLPKTIGPNKR